MKDKLKLIVILIMMYNTFSQVRHQLISEIEKMAITKTLPTDEQMEGAWTCIQKAESNIKQIDTTLSNYSHDLATNEINAEVITKLSGIIFAKTVVYQTFNFVVRNGPDSFLTTARLFQSVGIAKRNGNDINITIVYVDVIGTVFVRIYNNYYGCTNGRIGTGVDRCIMNGIGLMCRYNYPGNGTPYNGIASSVPGITINADGLRKVLNFLEAVGYSNLLEKINSIIS